MSLKTRVAFFFLFASTLPPAHLWAQEIDIQFNISPQLEQLRPLSELGTISLSIISAGGKPVDQGWVEIRLDAPKPGGFFSTDFPLVEGSRLVEMRLPIRQGKAQWQYLLPIRGEYRMIVEFVAADGKRVTKSLRFGIRENERKWFFLGVFTASLFAFGVVAGRIFSPPKAGHNDKLSVCLALSVGWLILPLGSAAAQELGKGKYVARLETDAATVGKPSLVHWTLLGEGIEAQPAAALTLTITHIEKEQTVFAVKKLPVAGEFIVNFHFTDGADYRIIAVAELPGRPLVRTEKLLSVTGVEPPARAMIPALVFFLTVVGSGLVVGRWSRRKATPS